jgi:hypothetical protein
MDRQIEFVKSQWEKIRSRLESAKAKIHAEIRDYPRPIPACDQQFNYLLEERARMARELDRMEAAFQESLARSDCLEVIAEFIQSSRYLGGDTEQPS